MAKAAPTNSQPAQRLIYSDQSSNIDAQILEEKLRADEKKLHWRDLQQFGQFITPFKWRIALGFGLTVALGLTALPQPYIFRLLLDEVFREHDLPLFFVLLAILLGVLILEEALRFLTRNVMGSVSRSANLAIVYRFYRHMLRLPLTFYQKLSSTGQVLSRLNEVTTVQQTVIQVVIDAAVAGILVVIYTVVLFLTEWHLTLLIISIAPFYLGTNLYFNRRVRKISRQVLESYAVMNGAMYEGLTGLKTVKALAAEHRFGRFIKKLVIQTNRLSFQRTILLSRTNFIIGIIQAIATLIMLSAGGYLVLSNVITAGQLAAFILILRELIGPVSALNSINQQIQTAAVAIDRLFEILDQPEESGAEQGIELRRIQGHIIMNNVHFSYVPGIEVLRNITLDVPSGTTIALVGRSGAGKTTIANLLMRFYLPNQGTISIDGYDLRDLKIEALRRQFGVILQDDALFSGTIEENLTFGLQRKVSYPEMEEAARNANILNFIKQQPLGFKTVLRERGQSLSNGQRQRLTIARMFLRQPRILIMDEPSSALDNESEALIQQALKRLTRGRTTFIIAHRLSTIRDADRIVIIDNGQIAEQGTHDELLANRGAYWQLYNSYGRV
ncbi:MAG TPA: peptidase domain-containing ABC transporter [Ktedonosporobacter sp.]|jgi:ABC-type bacteriocin/lantibiotic exporter with double-glycine peptidase domain|nr:peptidase domain-containing ABC transporter [Ktedonosporobacter sp.]